MPGEQWVSLERATLPQVMVTVELGGKDRRSESRPGGSHLNFSLRGAEARALRVLVSLGAT